MGEVKHHLHNHTLILNEAEAVVGKEVECGGCRRPINKLIDAFYKCNTSHVDGSPSSDCVGFFMHKTCSELPLTFTNPMYPQHPLRLFVMKYKKQQFYVCPTCEGNSQGLFYISENSKFSLCLKCVTSELKSQEERSLCHPAHNHPLTLVQSPALFLCHACDTTATDLSYICTKCCFWIHKTCADAPVTYQSKFHNEHTLILNYSLPQEYRNFTCHCSICEKIINPIYWVYYCANCRFFAHVKCASSESEFNDEADCGDSNLMHFPAHDEASLHEKMQQCIMETVNAHLNNTDTTIVEPSPCIKHWAHQHQLALRNNNTQTSNRKLSKTELLICDGCTNPISLVDIFYECNSCQFFLHRSCAQFPENIDHHLAGKLGGTLVQKLDELEATRCHFCGIYFNGICMWNDRSSLDIGCASLPRRIKHEAHRHPLNLLKTPDDLFCQACLGGVTKKGSIMYGCERCEYYIHISCVLRPHLVKHKWDPHPLSQILFPKNVADHPHEFECELCSTQIDPTTWFYHCNVCDLSFHPFCVNPCNYLSKIKFGATNFYSNSHPHPHGLTHVLNTKKRRCKICGEDAWSSRVLECSPCKYTAHVYCFKQIKK